MIAITRAARRVERPLDEPERPAPERVVVVLRRDERGAGPRAERAVDVGVDEVRVHDVGPQAGELPAQRPSEPGIEVAGARAAARTRPRELAVERLARPSRVVEPEEHGRRPRARASAGSSVSRWRSEPPMPRIRWTWTTRSRASPLAAVDAPSTIAAAGERARAGSPRARGTGSRRRRPSRRRLVGEQRDARARASRRGTQREPERAPAA